MSVSVFISSKHNDNYSNNLIDAIQSLLIDSIDIVDDKRIMESDLEVFDFIRECDYFICLIDRNSTKQMLELGYALGINKNIVLIGDNIDIPYELRNYTFIYKSEDYSKVLMSLIRIWNEELVENQNNKTNGLILDEIESIKDHSIISTMSYSEYENSVLSYLTKKNPSINILKANNVNDVPFDLTIPSLDCCIDIKKRSNNSKVSLSAIRSILDFMLDNNIRTGIVLSSTEFTLSALNFVKYAFNLNCRIILLTMEKLIKMDGNLLEILRKT